MNFRTKETYDIYKAFCEIHKDKKHPSMCHLCGKIKDEQNLTFAYWKILANDFPYDRIAQKHDLLVSRRHFAEEFEMNEEERRELVEIKTRVLPEMQVYDTMIENFKKLRSVEHYHIHLIKLKDER